MGKKGEKGWGRSRRNCQATYAQSGITEDPIEPVDQGPKTSEPDIAVQSGRVSGH